MADLRVTCVCTNGRTHEGITLLAGPGWRLDAEQVIQSIRDGSNTFYILLNGRRYEVDLADDMVGHHLQARSGSQWNNVLLTLPVCTQGP